jgi:hypothetical protein
VLQVLVFYIQRIACDIVLSVLVLLSIGVLIPTYHVRKPMIRQRMTPQRMIRQGMIRQVMFLQVFDVIVKLLGAKSQ